MTHPHATKTTLATKLTLALAVAAAAAAGPARAQAPTPPPPPPPAPAAAETSAPPYRFSGLVYADYYVVSQSHRRELEGQNGFWLRRLYFTYDHALGKSLALRVRLEANSRGDFKSTGLVTPYIKDAWLRWSFGAHALTFGMASTPSIDFAEAFQGYRALEKTPLDLYRWDSSRDLGLLLQGGFGKEARTRYAFQLGNGSGTGSEVDQSKSVRGQISHRFASGLVLEAYTDWQDRPQGKDVSTLEAFAGWRAKRWRASLQYARQLRREAGPGGSDLSLELVSAFAAVDLTPRVALVSRVDRNLDPVPSGETIDYLPFADTAKSTFALVAVDLKLAKGVQLMPNVELVRYDQASDGTRPGSDLVPRLTLFVNW